MRLPAAAAFAPAVLSVFGAATHAQDAPAPPFAGFGPPSSTRPGLSQRVCAPAISRATA